MISISGTPNATALLAFAEEREKASRAASGTSSSTRTRVYISLSTSADIQNERISGVLVRDVRDPNSLRRYRGTRSNAEADSDENKHENQMRLRHGSEIGVDRKGLRK